MWNNPGFVLPADAPEICLFGATHIINLLNEPVCEKKNNTLGFRPSPTQTGMYNHRRGLDT